MVVGAGQCPVSAAAAETPSTPVLEDVCVRAIFAPAALSIVGQIRYGFRFYFKNIYFFELDNLHKTDIRFFNIDRMFCLLPQ